MKRVIALLVALCCTVLFFAAMAETDQPVSPLLRLYQAEQTLLFDTMNVTMTGHAVFTVDGLVFKTADLIHIQDSTDSMRDWRLLTPTPSGISRETGYTVVTKGEHVNAYESYLHGHMRYGVEPARMRWSILRHTVAIDNLSDLASLILAQCGSIGECTATANADNTTSIAIHLTRKDIPAFLDPLLNSVLQYGINRYSGYDYALDSTVTDASYDCYNTISQGLMICLRSVHLSELTIDAVLDDQDRIQSVRGVVILEYEDKMLTGDSIIRLDFEQTAMDYGASYVLDDPQSYNHWGDADEPADPACETPCFDPALEDEATQLLLHGRLYQAPGSVYLHADCNCPTVSSRYLPMDRAILTPDLLLEHSFCATCLDASPFLNDFGEDPFDVAAGDLMAVMTYDENHGLNELYDDLIAKYGPFRKWSHAQKHFFTAMLPTLASREEQRIDQYHPSWLADTRLCEMLCIWAYGLPTDTTDEEVLTRAAAFARAEDLLSPAQLEQLSVSCDYYTGSSYALPFDQSWWVVRYADKTRPVCEIWLDSSLSNIHSADYQRMVSIAAGAAMDDHPELAGKPITREQLEAFDFHVLYLAEDHQWQCVFDSGTGSCWNVFLLDDDALTVEAVDTSNG